METSSTPVEMPSDNVQDGLLINEQFEEKSEASTPRRPLDIPLSHRLLAGPPYENAELLIQDLNLWAKPNGLGFVKLRSSNKLNGHYTRVDIACDRASLRPSRALSRRTSTCKTDCPWRAVAKSLVSKDRLWVMELKLAQHNHEPSLAPIVHRTHRGLTAEMKDLVHTLSKYPELRPRSITNILREQYPTVAFSPRDVENCRHRQKREDALNGSTTPSPATKARGGISKAKASPINTLTGSGNGKGAAKARQAKQTESSESMLNLAVLDGDALSLHNVPEMAMAVPQVE